MYLIYTGEPCGGRRTKAGIIATYRWPGPGTDCYRTRDNLIETGHGVSRMRTALLIVDVQNDYFPGGRNELSGPGEAAARVRLLLDAFRARQLPVVHVQHVSIRPGATFFLPDTPGVQIHGLARPAPGEPVVRKSSPNSFRNTELLQALKERGAGRLVVCGMMTHMCVDATVRAAFDLGFTCLVAGDACATRSLEYQGETLSAAAVHGAFLAALQGVYGRVGSAEEVLGQVRA